MRNLIFVFALLFLRVAIPGETPQLRICLERTGEPVAKMPIWPPEGEIVMVSNACNSIAVETFGARIVSFILSSTRC